MRPTAAAAVGGGGGGGGGGGVLEAVFVDVAVALCSGSNSIILMVVGGLFYTRCRFVWMCVDKIGETG